MSEKREAIGILASEACVSRQSDAKRWFHILKFTSAYRELLSRYDIYATDGTESLLREFLEKRDDPASLTICERLKQVGPDFRGVVRIAAMVANGDLHRVLMFQDPDDLGIERPANYALLRNCNLYGRKLYINATAHLWALYECQRNKIETRMGPNSKPMTYNTEPRREPIEETVVLIAHDGEKPRMARFVMHYRDVLNLFPRIIATSGTKRFIDKFQKDHHRPWERVEIKAAGNSDQSAHGPSGGDVVIADEVFATYSARADHNDYYSFYHILFFADHRSPHPHEPDIQVLLKTCSNPLNRVNLLLNSRMAEEWAERYLERASGNRP